MAKSQIICVVDDEPAIRETLENVLSDEGYPVMSCRDSEDFYAKLEKQTPALVLLDIWLPGTDGMAILSQLRETLSLILTLRCRRSYSCTFRWLPFRQNIHYILQLSLVHILLW